MKLPSFSRLGCVSLLTLGLLIPASTHALPGELFGIAAGDGMYVAAGTAGTILSSPDALHWTNRNSTVTNALLGVSFGAGQFVVVGKDGTILSSPDGIHFTQRPSNSSQDLKAVTFGNGQFLAVGGDGVVLRSPDGMTWTALATVLTNHLNDVTFGQGSFVVAEGDISTGAGLIHSSTDGMSWVPRATLPSAALLGVAYGNGRFVALGMDGTSLTSTNGTNWLPTFGQSYLPSARLAFGNGRFVAVTGLDYSQVAPNGFSWGNYPVPAMRALDGVAFANGRFVAVGADAYDELVILVSSDGVNWGNVLAPLSAPIITDQPQPGEAQAGESWNFTVMVVANPVPTFQWRFNGNDLLGATENQLQLDHLTASQSGNYSVVVRNELGAVTSLVARLIVPVKPPEFVRQPVDTDAFVGGEIYLDAYATAGPVATYRWYRNGGALAAQTNENLYLSNVTTPNAGDYFVVASNLLGVVTSRVARVTVSPSVFFAQPQSLFVSSGSFLQLVLGVGSTRPITVRWFFNGTNLPGPNTEIFQQPFATTNDAGAYFAVVSNIYGAVTSAVAMVGVDRMAPLITSQPESQSVLAGDYASFYVGAVGSPPLLLQWRKNGGSIVGARDFSFSTPATPTTAGDYDAVIHNLDGAVTSRVAVLTVNVTPPRFTLEPVDATVRVGNSAYFASDAVGGPAPTYQWLRNGSPMAGATSATLDFPVVSLDKTGDYAVVARNSEGSVTSRVARLSVYQVSPYFIYQPRDQAVLVGGTVSLYGYASGGPEPSYQWYFNGVALPGARGPDLNLPNATTNMSGDYWVVISSVAGVAVSRTATVKVSFEAPSFLREPVSQTVPWGYSFVLDAVATGGPPPSYQWFFNGVSIPGAIDSYLYFDPITPTNGGNYTVVISNAVGAATSAVAVITVSSQRPVITRQPTGGSVLWGEQSFAFYGDASGAPRPSFQWLFNGNPIPGALNPTFYLSYVTPAHAGNYYFVASNVLGAATSAVAVLAVRSQAPVFSQQPANQTVFWGDTAAFYASASGGPPPTYQWLFNGVPIPGETYPSIYLISVTPARAGNYRLVASSASGSSTSSVAVLTVRSQPPAFTFQPESRDVLWGDYVSLYAVAVGGPPPTLQWLFNGQPIPAATNNNFSFPNASPAQSGNYSVLASNSVGVTTSAVAVVTVNVAAPFFITEPIDLTVLWGDYLTLYAAAVGGPPPTLQWLFNRQPIPGANGNYLDLPNVAPAQSGNYSVVASNIVGVTTSAVAVLTVAAEAPYFLTEPTDITALWGDSVSFYAAASGGPPPVLQWFFNGKLIPGEYNTYLTLNFATPAQAGNYWAIASNLVGVTTSAVAVLTIDAQAPFFTSEPRDANVLWGNSFSLDSSAVGGPPPTFQWLLNGVPIPRERAASFYVPFATPTNAGNYQVVASNVVGVVTSVVAAVTVRSQAPRFSQEPYSQTALWGSYVSFYASAWGGPPPTYQWLFKGVPLPGQEYSSLTLQNVSPTEAGSYQVVASNPFGVVTSAVAVLTVRSQEPIFYQQPSSQTVLWGETVIFRAAASGGPPPTYQWLFNDVPIPGQTSPTLNLEYVTPDRSGSYRVMASNLLGTVSSMVAVLTVNSQAPLFTAQPVSQSALWGSYSYLFAAASGGPRPILQWWRNGVPLPGETNNSLTFEYITPAQAGDYSMIASNPVGVATSMVAVVTVRSEAPTFLYEPSDQTVLWGDPVDFYSDAPAGPPAIYQWHFNGAPLAGETNNNLTIPITTTNYAGLYYVVAANSLGSATSRVASLSVTVAAPEFQQQPDSAYALWGQNVSYYAWARGGPPPVYQWRFNGHLIPLATNNLLTLFSVTTNDVGVYDVIASNYLGSVASREVSLEVLVRAPEFSQTWPGAAAVEGTDVLLFARAYGGPPPLLTLLLNGLPLALPYAESGGFFLNEVTTNDSGAYTFVASNFVGSVTSTVAVLDVLPGGPLDRWTRRNPRPQAENLLAITYGDSRFVATGERGSVVSSTNGGNWGAQRVRADADLAGVAYGNGLFVSVSRAGNILTSSNAAAWVPRVFEPQLFLQDITFGNGRFVAVGGQGENASLSSTTGLDWTRGTASTPVGFVGVAYGKGRFVGVLQSTPSIMISSNGLTWDLTDVPSAVGLQKVAFAQDQFVAVGYQGVILTSPDGSSWTQRNSGVTQRLIDLAYGNGRWVAVGVRGIILSSADGVTWRSENSGTPDRLEGVTFADGLFVAVGENGTTLTSADAVVWTKQNLGSTRDLDGIAIGRNGQIVAVGKFGTILTTPDGLHIAERVAGTTNDLHGVAYANDFYVAVGDGGTIVTSSNGMAWKARIYIASSYYKSVTYGHGLWVAVGTRGMIITSTDGLNWVARNSGLTKDLNEVAYGNGLFMIVGDDRPPNGTVLTSADGISWVNRSIRSGKNLRGLTFANDLFLVVGNDGLIYVTKDGTFWEVRTSGVFQDGRNLRGATYAEGNWIVVGNDGLILTSTDTRLWQRRAPRTVENLHGVRYVNGTFVTIGNRGTILQSGRVLGPLLTPRTYDPQLGFIFSIEAEMDRTYRIQTSRDLLNWTDVLEFNNTQTTTLFLDEDALFEPLRYYRVVAP